MPSVIFPLFFHPFFFLSPCRKFFGFFCFEFVSYALADEKKKRKKKRGSFLFLFSVVFKSETELLNHIGVSPYP